MKRNTTISQSKANISNTRIYSDIKKMLKMINQEIDENTYGCEAALVSAKYSISLIQLLLAHLPENEKQAILEEYDELTETFKKEMKTVEADRKERARLARSI